MSKTLTAEEYLTLTQNRDDDKRYELVDGELIEMPPESPENLAIARLLLTMLMQYRQLRFIAYGTEIEVTGRKTRYRVPDLLVHTEESLTAIEGTGRATITRDMPPPELVIEVVSPGQINRDRDYRYKYTEYAARGISEYWIVDPEEQRITICQWIDGMYEDAVFSDNERMMSTVIPEWDKTVEQVIRGAL